MFIEFMAVKRYDQPDMDNTVKCERPVYNFRFYITDRLWQIILVSEIYS